MSVRAAPLAAAAAALLLLSGGRGAGAAPAPREVVHVGPGRQFRLPSEAAAAVGDGAIVEIDPGTYRGDVAVWRQNDLTIEGLGAKQGKRPHLVAAGRAAQGKAIWVIQGRNVRISNIEFSGAKVADLNGAGLRLQGVGRTIVSHCYFHDNQDGILASNIASSEIDIERSEFAHNGAGDGYSHNIYVGRVKSFTLRFSFVHDAHVGHEVKSRARLTRILYDWIGNLGGDGSYLLDVPDGGTVYVIGSVLEKGAKAENRVAVSFAEESRHNPTEGYFLVNDTFVSHLGGAIFVRNLDPRAPVRIVNSLFAGPGTVLAGRGSLSHSLAPYRGGFVDAARHDYHLKAGSPAIGAGIDPGQGAGRALAPDAIYRPVAGGRAEAWPRPLDLGAFPHGS